MAVLLAATIALGVSAVPILYAVWTVRDAGALASRTIADSDCEWAGGRRTPFGALCIYDKWNTAVLKAADENSRSPCARPVVR